MTKKLTPAEANRKVTIRLRKRAFKLLRSELRNAAAMLEVIRANTLRAPRNRVLHQWARMQHKIITMIIARSRELEEEDIAQSG